MTLIGQYDSPFVRRVAIAMQIYDLAYDHKPWSTFRDADKFVAYNPLTRVPTLVLDDGTVLIESSAILDWLDELAGEEKALIAVSGLARRSALKTISLAMGLCDKMVSLVYERSLHATTSEVWIARCEAQVGRVLDVLEAEAAELKTPFWFGETPGHADIAVACATRFLGEAHRELSNPHRWTALFAHSARCEARPDFSAVVQAFIAPGK
jgi:glutathione S-transferase